MKTDRLAKFKNWILISSDIKYVESQAVQEESQKKLPFIYQEGSIGSSLLFTKKDPLEASPFYFLCCSGVPPSPKKAM